MPERLTRRTLLATSLAAAAGWTAGALVSRPAWAQGADSIKSTSLTPLSLASISLGEGLWLFQGAGGNAVAAGDRDELLLVDSGSPEMAAQLERRVRAESGARRVTTLLNTHWHWDHTGGNEVFGKSGATIVAHENTKLWLGTQVISKWENRTYAPRPARALPTKTFYYGTEQMTVGKRVVEYGYLPKAHTDGDLYVFFPKENVLVAGGVVSGGSYPVADYCTNGWLGGMVAALQTLIAKSDSATRIVPGEGPVRTKADLQAQLDLCRTVLGRIAKNYYTGKTWPELLSSKPTREFDARWGDPALFLQTAYEGAWLHINEIQRLSR